MPHNYIAEIQWESVTAISAAAGLIGAVMVWAVGSIVDRKFSDFLIQLNGTYLRKELAEAKFDEVHRRIDEMHGHSHR
jgi:hypothetical protein